MMDDDDVSVSETVIAESVDSLPNPALEPCRTPVVIMPGAFVAHDGLTYRVSEVIDFQTVIAVSVASGRSHCLAISALRPVEQTSDMQDLTAEDFAVIADSDWRIAQERFAAISPLCREGPVQPSAVQQRAQELGLHPATLYRWLKRYNACGTAIGLMPHKRGWKTGKSRISADAEAIIQAVIDDYYLTAQRPVASKVVTEVQRRCLDAGIKAPSHMAIRARLIKVPEKQRLRGQGFREQARNRFRPAPGHFPNADYPLAVVQIDHTPADIILVDDVHRLPIGRPWITLAVDVYSRMIVGYYLSFDPPSETSVAMCVAHAILPKEDWLLRHRIDADWPVWGVPRTIHVDNGADFRANTFQQACLAYGINLEFRPVRQPHFGGHIERLLGTLLREIHDLPGTTFSSIKDREGYDSDKHASLTLAEFETWLVKLITQVYHRRRHTALRMSPLARWEGGVFGDGIHQGSGLPARPADRHTVFLDFLPAFRRTVQPAGVAIEGLSYYDEALRPWISALDDETGKKREFVFRRDPRDISAVWFFDPLLKQYFKIPFADQSLPVMSVWEYRQARDRLKQEGAASIDERSILRALSELREQVDAAQARTRKARRQVQRRKDHARQSLPLPSQPSLQPVIEALGALCDGDADFFQNTDIA